jgi:hypothetical protein
VLLTGRTLKRDWPVKTGIAFEQATQLSSGYGTWLRLIVTDNEREKSALCAQLAVAPEKRNTFGTQDIHFLSADQVNGLFDKNP